MEQEVLVKVTAHRGIIVIDAILEDTHPDWFPVGDGRIGCVLHNTKEHLGVSAEALDLLAKVPRSGDSIGDVDWFGSDNGNKCFCWLGPPKRFVNPQEAEGSRDYTVFREDCKVIPNDPPALAMKLIDEALGHQEVPSG